jgi:uncharacterized membrane protein YecN with MAPEG domain
MRGVHRKVEEPPRWTPTLTPIQRKLQRRLELAIYANALEYIAGGVFAVMEVGPWVWWVFCVIGTIVFAWGLLTMRALTRTGPPFDQVRWWWPWRFPRH